MRAAVPQLRNMVPGDVHLPLEQVDATIWVGLEVREDGVVVVPGLAEIAEALPPGSVEFIEAYCGMWTRWLERVEMNAQVPA